MEDILGDEGGRGRRSQLKKMLNAVVNELLDVNNDVQEQLRVSIGVLKMVAPLSTWPWENLGNFKYLLYGPLVAQVIYSRMHEEAPKMEWCLHILAICTLRLYIYLLCCIYGRMYFFTKQRLIDGKTVDFNQIDSEWHWENFLILHGLIASVACYSLPFINVPLWNLKGIICALIFHVGVSEPLYYFIHKKLHSNQYLFTHYHSLHHSSPVQECLTAGHATPLEHLILGVVMGIPMLATCLMGLGSLGMIYGYVFFFDCLRCVGLFKSELVPCKIFEILPFLKYVIYTTSFELQGTRLCVLCHCVDVTSSLHSPFYLRSFLSLPFKAKWFLLPHLPTAFITMVAFWIKSRPFIITGYTLRKRLHQSWCVPRYGFQYFLPFAKDGINSQIEDAILEADKSGVKNEALNGGGALFVKKHPDLRVRVVHGNTLTAAVILNEIPNDVQEVFLTGATSKLGRAIALHLCRKKVRVMMMTQSEDRFKSIQMEAPYEYQSYLIQVTKYQAGQNCKTWIAGKWLTPRQQGWAPAGTHFHQFVVPMIMSFRRDCTYGKLAAMKLPEDVEGLGSCEYTMPRGVVHACHAGGLVHFLEGYKHHEVGTIDVDMIDVVWEAALKHGLRPDEKDKQQQMKQKMMSKNKSKVMKKKKKKTLLKKLVDYLMSDSYMYAPLINSRLSDVASTTPKFIRSPQSERGTCTPIKLILQQPLNNGRPEMVKHMVHFNSCISSGPHHGVEYKKCPPSSEAAKPKSLLNNLVCFPAK
ncbi:hypothetical protein Sjap_010737 [Stephania japonica]|uniref:Uncharacterized protein n=1 Tax=Stephania japonica TaxID=461633 RepID=A0AAP0JB07_9MAGN